MAKKPLCQFIVFPCFCNSRFCFFVALIRNCTCHFWQKKLDKYHRLRGSASPVLTATGLVNGNGQISTPTESTPLNRSPKKLSQVITSAIPTAVPN